MNTIITPTQLIVALRERSKNIILCSKDNESISIKESVIRGCVNNNSPLLSIISDFEAIAAKRAKYDSIINVDEYEPSHKVEVPYDIEVIKRWNSYLHFEENIPINPLNIYLDVLEFADYVDTRIDILKRIYQKFSKVIPKDVQVLPILYDRFVKLYLIYYDIIKLSLNNSPDVFDFPIKSVNLGQFLRQIKEISPFINGVDNLKTLIKLQFKCVKIHLYTINLMEEQLFSIDKISPFKNEILQYLFTQCMCDADLNQKIITFSLNKDHINFTVILSKILANCEQSDKDFCLKLIVDGKIPVSDKNKKIKEIFILRSIFKDIFSEHDYRLNDKLHNMFLSGYKVGKSLL